LVRAPSVAFLCRATPRDARQKKFTVRCQKRRTTMGVHRANYYRVLFAVRPVFGLCQTSYSRSDDCFAYFPREQAEKICNPGCKEAYQCRTVSGDKCPTSAGKSL
jgi:hypothetical protein